MRISNNTILFNLRAENTKQQAEGSVSDRTNEPVITNADSVRRIEQPRDNISDKSTSIGNDLLSEHGFESVLHQSSFGAGARNPLPNYEIRGDNIGYWGTDASDQLRIYGDVIYAELGAGDDSIRHWGDNGTYFGEEGDDDIRAQGSNHVMHAGNGNDRLVAAGADNTLYGGDGEDRLVTRRGYGNTSYGGNGNDDLVIEELFDDPGLIALPPSDPSHVNKMYGEAGDDLMTIRSRARQAAEGYGGIGDDEMYIIGGKEHKLFGGDGDDEMQALAGSNDILLNGDAGSDSILIRSMDSEANGGEGNDLINNEGVRNIVNGDAGDDVIVVHKQAIDARSYGGDGNDAIIQFGAHFASGGAGDDRFTSIDGSGSTFAGGDGKDVLNLDIPLGFGISIKPAIGTDNTYFTVRDGDSADANEYQISGVERINFSNGFSAEQNENGDWYFFESE